MFFLRERERDREREGLMCKNNDIKSNEIFVMNRNFVRELEGSICICDGFDEITL